MSSKKNEKHIVLQWYYAIENIVDDSFWQASSVWERAIGAVLSQNTTWKNAQKALLSLKETTLFTKPAILFEYTEKELQEYIRPSGFFVQKTKALLALFSVFSTYNFSENKLQEEDTSILREKFLSCKGIGQETADLLLLFCFNHLLFPVNTFTARITQRHGAIEEYCSYQDLQDFFMDVLPKNMVVYKRYYLALLYIAQTWCKKNIANCAECALCSFQEKEYYRV